MSIEGRLFVVATPIGNLGDLSPRAVQVLESVDRIAAEDTRHSHHLLVQFQISKPMVPLHEHNEARMVGELITRLRAGERIAVISDAGTPLISDPGFRLVRAAHEAGIAVTPVPGPSAALAALSVSGLPTDRFGFEGFLPSRPGPRRRALEGLAREDRTLIFYEAPHRILDALRDMVDVFGGDREATFAREMTKAFETVRTGTLAELLAFAQGDPDQRRGEIVVVVGGAPASTDGDAELSDEAKRIAVLLAAELPPRKAAALTADITGARKNQAYEFIVQSKGAEKPRHS